jgi:hypothetical protein
VLNGRYLEERALEFSFGMNDVKMHSGFWAVENKTRMAKISIPVNPRDLRDVLQSSLERVPSARIHALLRTLEKIALQTAFRGGL